MMKHLIAALGLLALAGCSQLQQFTAGDLANAAALAGKADPVGAQCWGALSGAAAATPASADDGIATLAERKRLVIAAVQGACGAVIAPALLQDIGKVVPAPANLLLPF